ncbi:xanthine dehydrogenase family protein molybdopterin-binding subunit [Actinomadura rugatobispora]|uniref:Xanthine dehydrogenase family protein molybdopterin-binding subunit n=1 Tax=Actinomadura rugatobispora TaxID=1994 RepID=A0ABW1A2B4_9ACTN|nr:xanthine dehydrogenase molybdenum-binding subunit XdhA [Actinomadura rugatobispora]
MHDADGSFSVVGRAVPRVDAWAKVTGRHAFLTDMSFGGDAWMRLVRSPHPKAKLTGLLVDAPGVVAVRTAADVPRVRFNPALAPSSDQLRAAADRPLLATTARHVGDAVAVVVATSAAHAEDAVRAASTEWNVLEPVLDIDAALQRGAVIGRMDFGDDRVDGALAASAVVVEERFEVAGAQHVCLETHACRAEPAGGGVRIWSNTQSPGELRSLVAEILGMDDDRVHVRKVDEGGGFGCRQELYEEALAAWLALDLNRPVRVVYDREEELHATRRRHALRARVRLGLDDDGVITGIDLDAVVDSGAYASHAPYVANAVALTVPATYPHAAYRFSGRVVRTNTLPGGAYRGYGVAQANVIVEGALDLAARRMGLDPIEVRRRNSPQRLRQCLDVAARVFPAPPRANDRPSGNLLRGHGVAVAAKATVTGDASDVSTASLTRTSDRGAVLVTGTCDAGTGSSTVLAQIVAEELGISVADVQVLEGDTERGHVDVGSASQRSVLLGAGAAREAARTAHTAPGVPVTYRASPVPPSYCACFVTVLVDMELGTVHVERCDVVTDCGRVLNPLGALGQVHGACVQGLGLALIDLWSADATGRGPGTVQEHGVPTALDVPDVGAVFTGEPSENAPYGGLGLGELPIVPVPAAVLSAVADATGVLPTTIPLRPSALWQALRDGAGSDGHQ